MRYSFLKVAAAAGLVAGLAGCKPESVESLMEQHVVSMDKAMGLFAEGKYELFREQFRIAFEPSIEIYSRIPTLSVDLIKKGTCANVTALAYRRFATDYLEPMAEFYIRNGKVPLGDEHRIAKMLDGLAKDKRVGRYLIEYQPSTRDCNKYYEDYYAAVEGAEQYVLASVDNWIVDFERLTGRDAQGLVEEYSASARRDRPANWAHASASDRNLYTGGDREIESCISATIGSGTPAGVSVNGIATLCRNGLNR